ncbi:hypothetical protein B0H14DRAFT_2562661 [Mycena olivaceomarginata]|nr:hypothetical protein B0H14DRAFT_2562661 [Mycena olivaceomarginata]
MKPDSQFHDQPLRAAARADCRPPSNGYPPPEPTRARRVSMGMSRSPSARSRDHLHPTSAPLAHSASTALPYTGSALSTRTRAGSRRSALAPLLARARARTVALIYTGAITARARPAAAASTSAPQPTARAHARAHEHPPPPPPMTPRRSAMTQAYTRSARQNFTRPHQPSAATSESAREEGARGDRPEMEQDHTPTRLHASRPAREPLIRARGSHSTARNDRQRRMPVYDDEHGRDRTARAGTAPSRFEDAGECSPYGVLSKAGGDAYNIEGAETQGTKGFGGCREGAGRVGAYLKHTPLVRPSARAHTPRRTVANAGASGRFSTISSVRSSRRVSGPRRRAPQAPAPPAVHHLDLKKPQDPQHSNSFTCGRLEEAPRADGGGDLYGRRHQRL